MTLAEVILKREMTRFSSVLPLLTQIYIDAHNWNADDYVAETYSRKQEYILAKILIANIKSNKIRGNVVYSPRVKYDDSDPSNGYIVQEVDMDKSDVDFKALIPLIIEDVGDLTIIPVALKKIAGVHDIPDNAISLDPQPNSRIDKLVCQGIAKTLWYLDSKRTLKDIANHYAIQNFGNGNRYKDPKTLAGWLSEVDPRPEDQRRGPKKKREGDNDVI